MRIIGLKKRISILATSLVAVAASAQQGIGTDTPHKSSVLELQSSKRGLLVPRIRLTATDQKAPVNDPANSLLVYNTNTTSGSNAVTPGYYYWSQADNSWMRIINQKDVAAAIANIADTKVTGATLSGTTLTIKQSGSTPDITVNLAALDTNTTYSADNTSVKLTGTTFKRGALTGDVESAEGSTETKVTKIQGQAVSATPATNGQVLKWNGTAWAPAADENTSTTYSADNTSVKLTGTTFKRGALTGDVESAEGSTETKVTKIQGQAVSATPATNGQVLKWNGTAWAPAADVNTQSKETVVGTGVVTVTGSGSTGDNNRSFTVGITPAGVSETKVLQSVNGIVQWADAPAAATPSSLNTIGGTAKVVDNIEISTWGNPGDVFLCVTTTTAAIDLPDPEKYAGRIISVNNQAASATNYASNSPKNRSAIVSGMGHLLMSVGVPNGSGVTYRWHIIGGSY